jgi:hypothetical protein
VGPYHNKAPVTFEGDSGDCLSLSNFLFFLCATKASGIRILLLKKACNEKFLEGKYLFPPKKKVSNFGANFLLQQSF